MDGEVDCYVYTHSEGILRFLPAVCSGSISL